VVEESEDTKPSAIAANPVQVLGSGPSAITYSISGWAHSAEPKSPRSQAAKIDRTSCRFADSIRNLSIS
jgi:hypothetical protein